MSICGTAGKSFRRVRDWNPECVSSRTFRIRKIICAQAKQSQGDSSSGRRCGEQFEAPTQLFQAVYPSFSGDPTAQAATVESPPGPTTVYTVRFSTSYLRGSALDDLFAGVQLCMIGKQGKAMLHRIPQIEDRKDSEAVMKQICEIVDKDAGAKCDIPNSLQRSYQRPSPYIKRRFSEGAVDEISFVGLDLGPLTGILVGPEAGSWQLEEVSIRNSRESITQQFICRDWLGKGKNPGAAYMTPIPPGAVVYGSGDQAVLMTKKQAETMKDLGLKEYKDLKGRITSTATGLILTGMAVAGITGGVEAAEAFAVGGLIGFINFTLLSKNVDRLPLGATYNGSPYGAPDVLGKQALGVNLKDDWARGVLGSGPFRLALTTSLMLASILCVQLWDDGVSHSERQLLELSAVATALLGFAMYKVAIIAVTLAPSKPPAKVKAREIKKL